MLYQGKDVLERIEYGVNQGDKDAIQAKKWFSNFQAKDSKKTGVDGHIVGQFKKVGNAQAANKFVDLK